MAKNIRDCFIKSTDAEKTIASMLRELRHLQALAVNTTVTLGGERVTGGGGVHDRMAQCVADITTLEGELKVQTAALLENQHTMREIIRSIHSPRRRMLMRMRYLEGLTWERIADFMDVSPRSVYQLHDRILNDLEAAYTDKPQ